MIDIARVRSDTPSCRTEIHCNAAGSSPMPAPVARTVRQYLEREEQIGGYAAEVESEAALEDFYDAFAALLGCTRDEIAFVENATRAWDMAFYGVPFEPGDRILTCSSEYGSNYVAFLQMARQKGVAIDVADDDQSGQVSTADLERRITARTRLIAISHVPTQGGLVNPVEAIGTVARAHGVLYLVDACQSLGQMPVDVNRVGCDFLSSTGRKFLRGPRGTGVLYARRSVIEGIHPPLIDAQAARWVSVDRYELRNDARRFENFECNFAGKAGLAHAVRYAMDLGLDNIWERVKRLSVRLRESLAQDPQVELTDLGREKCGIVTLRRRDEDPMDTWRRLDAARIRAWRTSRDWALLDLERRGFDRLVRLSVHYFNTEEEVETVSRVVRGAAG